MLVFFFFFFQAEDGIRDLTVTGVQTCALPILRAFDRSLFRCCQQAVWQTFQTENLVRASTPNEDRKSTRLNSSHSQISYAVFCLKKKKKYQNIMFSYT